MRLNKKYAGYIFSISGNICKNLCTIEVGEDVLRCNLHDGKWWMILVLRIIYNVKKSLPNFNARLLKPNTRFITGKDYLILRMFHGAMGKISYFYPQICFQYVYIYIYIYIYISILYKSFFLFGTIRIMRKLLYHLNSSNVRREVIYIYICEFQARIYMT